jgi:ribonuclease J
MKTQIDFFGGVDEIGGNKVRVSDGSTSIFLDFGMSFSKANDYFSEFLQPRKSNGIIDFLELGMLPNINGIYREDYLNHCGISSDPDPSINGVLISHAHMDHSAYIHHLREDIPIYVTEQSYLIMKTLEETSTASFNELINFKKSFYLKRKTRIKNGTSEYTEAKGVEYQLQRDIKILDPYKEFSIGDIKITPVPVDHSLPGACAYFVDTSDEKIVYTGDLRFHGRHPELTNKFVSEAKKFRPTIMLSEGTRIDSASNIDEQSIENSASEIISNFNGHVIVNYPIRDLDRFLTFYNVANNTNRRFAVNLKQAYMLNLFDGHGYPKVEDVDIYIPRKKWGMMGNETFACIDEIWHSASELHPYHLETDYKLWERDYLNYENTVNYKDIKENPNEYIFGCDFFELKELIDIKPENGLYIWSKTEPFNEEMTIDFEKVKNWINHFNLKLIVKGMHGSGHANGNEIIEMIREIQPEKLYPIHTEKKELFNRLNNEKITVTYPNQSY